MKRLNKYGVGTILLAASCTLTGCIEETFPTQNAVIDQVGSSETAIEATWEFLPSSIETFSQRVVTGTTVTRRSCMCVTL